MARASKVTGDEVVAAAAALNAARAELERVVVAYRQQTGLSLRELGKMVGYTGTGIQGILRRHDVA